METILDYSWSSQKISNVPTYAVTHTRSPYDHVSQSVPIHCRVPDLMNIIVDYLDPNGSMIRVDVNLAEMIRCRQQDAFFIYDILSRVDPIPKVFMIPRTLPDVRSSSTIEKASCPILLTRGKNLTNKEENYYRTRTGHLGKLDELMDRSHRITLQGQLTYTRPDINQFSPELNYLIITHTSKITQWTKICPRIVTKLTPGQTTGNILLIDINETLRISPEVSDIPWNMVLLDQVSMTTTCFSDPNDTSRIMGHMSERLMSLYDTIIRNCESVLYITNPNHMNNLRILDCMVFLRVTYDGRLLMIPGPFSINRHLMIRVSENIFS
jgi:hypothetical protein